MNSINNPSSTINGLESITKIGEGGCKHYCQNSTKNHTCGRTDISCNNLKNCDENHKKIYQILWGNFEIKKIGESIEECNDIISHIY